MNIEKVKQILESAAWSYDEHGRLALIGNEDFLMASKKILNNFILLPKNLAQEFCNWSVNESFCNSGQHVVDRLSIEIEQQIKM